MKRPGRSRSPACSAPPLVRVAGRNPVHKTAFSLAADGAPPVLLHRSGIAPTSRVFPKGLLPFDPGDRATVDAFPPIDQFAAAPRPPFRRRLASEVAAHTEDLDSIVALLA